jgi:hypothetical protein
MERKRRLLQLIGPGLITGASDDDPSGIGTYSQAGAQPRIAKEQHVGRGMLHCGFLSCLCPLWVNRARSIHHPWFRHVRFAPKADK